MLACSELLEIFQIKELFTSKLKYSFWQQVLYDEMQAAKCEAKHTLMYFLLCYRLIFLLYFGFFIKFYVFVIFLTSAVNIVAGTLQELKL